MADIGWVLQAGKLFLGDFFHTLLAELDVDFVLAELEARMFL